MLWTLPVFVVWIQLHSLSAFVCICVCVVGILADMLFLEGFSAHFDGGVLAPIRFILCSVWQYA